MVWKWIRCLINSYVQVIYKIYANFIPCFPRIILSPTISFSYLSILFYWVFVYLTLIIYRPVENEDHIKLFTEKMNGVFRMNGYFLIWLPILGLLFFPCNVWTRLLSTSPRNNTSMSSPCPDPEVFWEKEDNTS